MTPDQAAERMHKIKKHEDREKAIELLVEIARKSGFFDAAEIFEKIK